MHQNNNANKFGVVYPFTIANTVMFSATAFTMPLFKQFLSEDNSDGRNFGIAFLGMWITMSAGMFIGNLGYAIYKYPQYKKEPDDPTSNAEARNPFKEMVGNSFMILRMCYNDQRDGCGDPWHQRDTALFDVFLLTISSAMMLKDMSTMTNNYGDQLIKGFGTTLTSYFGAHVATSAVNIFFRGQKPWEEQEEVLAGSLLGHSRRGSIAPNVTTFSKW